MKQTSTCTYISFLGVNVEQELPSPSSTHPPKTAQGCSLLWPRTSVGPTETRSLADLSPGSLSSRLQRATAPARWRQTGLPKKTFCRAYGFRAMRLCYPRLAPIHRRSTGTSQRRRHILQDALPVLRCLPVGLHAAAGNKTQPPLETEEVFCLLN